MEPENQESHLPTDEEIAFVNQMIEERVPLVFTNHAMERFLQRLKAPTPNDVCQTVTKWLLEAQLAKVMVDERGTFYRMNYHDWYFVMKYIPEQNTWLVITCMRSNLGSCRNRPRYKNQRAEYDRQWRREVFGQLDQFLKKGGVPWQCTDADQ